MIRKLFYYLVLPKEIASLVVKLDKVTREFSKMYKFFQKAISRRQKQLRKLKNMQLNLSIQRDKLVEQIISHETSIEQKKALANAYSNSLSIDKVVSNILRNDKNKRISFTR